MKKSIIICAAILAAGGVACSLILVKPSIVLKYFHDDTVSVKGVASERVESDFAKWNGSITAKGATAVEAMARLKSQSDAAVKEFEAASIKNIKLSGASVSEVLKQKSNEVDYYSASIDLSCEFPDVSEAAKIEGIRGKLLSAGIGLTSYPVSYYYTKLEGLKLKMLSKAMENARERVKALVGANAEVGGISSASQGVFHITAPLSSDYSDWSGTYDLSTPQKDVRCVVTVSFYIKQKK